MRHLLDLLKRTRRHELVGECKLASLWHANIKPPTASIIMISYIASLKAQISFIVGRLRCVSHAMRHLLSVLKRTRGHELVGECKLATLWHAKLKPPTTCIIIISYIASLKAQLSFIVWRLGCVSHAMRHLVSLLKRTRGHELVGECKLATLWHAKLKPPTTCIIIISYIASLKAQISFIVWRLGCANHAMRHLLSVLKRTRGHELVCECKLASLWHAKLTPPTASVIIIS
jgi:hypothetical protein